MSECRPKFHKGDICLYEDCGSGNNGYSGRICRVIAVIDAAAWFDRTAPEYWVKILPDGPPQFHVWECELSVLPDL